MRQVRDAMAQVLDRTTLADVISKVSHTTSTPVTELMYHI
jgi:DNA-binding IscR family transcriptional regulator